MMNGRVLVVGLVAVFALAVAACTSEEGDGAVTLPETDISAPEVSAPTTAAPTTAAPSQPDSGDSGSGSSSSSDETNTGAIWALVIGGIIVVGLVAYFASRSGAKKGAEEQRNAELAEQQRADEAARRAQYEAMPPPVPADDLPAADDHPGGQSEPSDGQSDAP